MGLDRWGDITLINPGGAYSQVVDRIVYGIARHLDRFNVWPYPAKGTFNVHFFREWISHPTQRGAEFCDMFIAHGWNQKLFGVFKANLDNFRYTGVPGPMTRDFLIEKGMPPERIVIVGHPGMDTIINGEIPNDPTDDGRPKIVLAISHSSFIGHWAKLPIAFSEAFREAFNVVEVVHPTRGWRLSRDVMQGASACISDISGTIFEAWTFGVPVVFPHWLIGKAVIGNTPGSPLSRIYGNEIGYHIKAAEDVEETIWSAATEGITQPEIDFIDEYFPPRLRGNSGKVAAEAIKELAGTKR